MSARAALRATLVAGLLAAGCGTGTSTSTSTSTTGSSTGASAAAPPRPFRGRDAAERLRQRAVGWVVADLGGAEPRLEHAVAVLTAIPLGHVEERRLVEAGDGALAKTDLARRDFVTSQLANRIAQRWLARREVERARATLARVGEGRPTRRVEEIDELVALTLRLDGRDAALRLAEHLSDPGALELALARAEARHGDFAWATEIARRAEWFEGCSVWNALVVRHVRDGRDAASGEAWGHARAAATMGDVVDGSRVECLVGLVRAANEVGRHDEVAQLFATLPTGPTWPACRVLDELGADLDPLRLDVPVAIVALRRDEPGPPRPSCPRTAAWIAARAGELDLARSLRARAVATGGGTLGGLSTDWRHGWLGAVATGEVDAFAPEIDGRAFTADMLPQLVQHFDEHGDEPVDEARFDVRFPSDRAPWSP